VRCSMFEVHSGKRTYIDFLDWAAQTTGFGREVISQFVLRVFRAAWIRADLCNSK